MSTLRSVGMGDLMADEVDVFAIESHPQGYLFVDGPEVFAPKGESYEEWLDFMHRHRPRLLVFPSPPEPDRRCLRRIELQRLVHEDGRWAAVQVTVRAFGIEVRLALSRK